MTSHAVLIKEIEKLPQKYFGEVLNFVGYLQQKAKSKDNDEIAAYKAMAADKDRELEAHEWCNAYFGPACNCSTASGNK